MDRGTLILLHATLLPCLALNGRPLGTAEAVARAFDDPVTVEMTTEDTAFGCKINMVATNRGSQRTAISRDSQVRSFAGLIKGPWKKLDKSIWVNPGATERWYYDLTFGCNVDRGFRFLVKQFDKYNRLLGETWYSFPEDVERSRNTSIDLGNLDRFF